MICPTTVLQCFVLEQRESKAKHCRNVLGCVLGRKKLDTKSVLKSVIVYDYTVGKGWDHLNPCISKLE